MSLNTPKFGSLQDVNVIVAGNAVAGPHAGALLAENGATVIHIEGSNMLNVNRGTGSGYSVAVEHRNVYEFGLDYVKNSDGRKVFLDMLKTTDILIESNKGGRYEKWGLTDEYLWEINPKLVIVHISGFGETGDPYYYERASYDFIGQAFAGHTHFTNDFSKPVSCDYATGMYGALLGMMGLYNAQVNGEGESIDVSQYETMLRLQHFSAPKGLTEEDHPLPEPFSGCDSEIAGETSYTCKDGQEITLFMAGGAVMARGAKLMGFEDEASLSGKAIIYKEDPASELYIQYIRDFCASHDAEEVERLCVENGIPCSPIMTYETMLTNPHYQARNSIVEYYSDNMGKTIKAEAPVGKFKRNPQQIWKGASKHGAENDEILEAYGYSNDEIAALYETGAVGKLNK